MLYNEYSDIFEHLRTVIPFALIVLFPILIVMSPAIPGADGAYDFPIYRIRQFDHHGNNYGSRGASFSLEGRSPDAKLLLRKCVVARLKEVTPDKIRKLMDMQIGALVIVLPASMTSMDDEAKEALALLEKTFATEDIIIPVFVAHENEKLKEVLTELKHAGAADAADSAAGALFSSIFANGYQVDVTGPPAAPVTDFTVTSLQGKLIGNGIEEQLPSIIIVAHYDATGIAPSLSFGADANGSGVAALLELARLLSQLYTDPRTQPRTNVHFVLTGAGTLNFMGAKRWIDHQLDEAQSLGEVPLVLCLDALANKHLYLHVSKPPKEGSFGAQFLSLLEAILASNGLPPPQLVHKKINLAEDMLAWEHERFSMRRLPAATLSGRPSSPVRTAADVSLNLASLEANVKVLAETLARLLFNTSSGPVLSRGPEPEALDGWVKMLTAQGRSPAMFAGRDNPLLQNMEQALQHHTKEASRHAFRIDKRDPEFTVYSGFDYRMAAHHIKPAVFDLVLSLGIAAYVGLVYVFVLYYDMLAGSLRRLIRKEKTH